MSSKSDIEPSKLDSIDELKKYWHSIYAKYQSGELSREEAAYQMVNVVGNPHFDKWDQSNPKLGEIFDLAADVETGIQPEWYQAEAWQKVGKTLKQL